MKKADWTKLTDAELDAEVESCREEIDFWAVDLGSSDSDYVADAVRGIRDAKWRMEEIRQEIDRRKGVTG